MFYYETHLHTMPVSRCGAVSVRNNLEFYKKKGYQGVFITNHFIDGNINIDKSLPFAERIEFYFSDYEEGKKIGREIGLDVFCGIETSYKGTDCLVFGLDKHWFLTHPEIENMERSALLQLYLDSGALVIQAHPFREAFYIDHIRLFPRHVHGVEIFNGGCNERENRMAEIYCDEYDLIPFAGTDNHRGARQEILYGVETEEKVESVEHFIELVKSRKIKTFTRLNSVDVVSGEET